MSRSRNEICAQCRKFPIRNVDKEGRAWCPDYEQMKHWRDPATVLFMYPKQSEELSRRRLIEELETLEKNRK